MTDGAYTFHPTILREYDIRGIVGKTLGKDDARAVGRAFGTMVDRAGGRKVAVGYDGRLSSPELEAAMVEGLRAAGMVVLRIGLGPTPMLYYAAKTLGADAGVMITGSHNPPEYNGIKMVLQNKPVYGAMIQEIGTIAKSGNFARGSGAEEVVDVKDAYVDRLLADYDGDAPLTVAWDAGNGATGEILRRMAARLPGTHHLLYDQIDGTFPNHHPDPTIPENMEDLAKVVSDKVCHLGIGFDGDGDRIGAVDEKGRIVWGDQLVAIYAQDVLESHPGGTIIADVKTSQTIFDEVARLGGKPLMWKTGHSLLKAKMAEVGSPLAGEMSGHIFFADKWYGFDDALYCGVRLISLVSRRGGSLAALRDRLPQVFNTPETRFQVDEERKFKSIEEIKARVMASGAQVNDIDGVRVTTPDGWWLLRASNTQDVLVARAEAYTEDGLERLKGNIREQLKQSRIDAPSGF
ncbi:MAG TPA: phosphomannomutase/phosphoglucomutase [Azospirillaceae bacterium]|nr:phosphomannomutase/phosphoglucomutase [Azospirillaceae bacterium]